MAGISSKAISRAVDNKYKYNGKEEQRKEFADESGLDWMDYGARMYDEQVGRWNSLDPLCGYFVSVSGLVFDVNEPINRHDPSGRAVEKINGGLSFDGVDAIDAARSIMNSFGVGGTSKVEEGNQNEGPADEHTNGAGQKFTKVDGQWGITQDLETVVIKGKSTKNSAKKGDENGDINASSNVTSGVQTEVGLAEFSLKAASKGADISEAERLVVKDALKYSKVLGKGLGVLSSAFVLGEAYAKNGKITWGDATKATITFIATFGGPAGWLYTAVDLSVGMATGKTITDRIGEKIDGK